MPQFSTDIIKLLYALMPGFLAAWVFLGLTARKVPSPFERTVQALIYTAIIQVLALGLRGHLYWLVDNQWCESWGKWSENVQLGWSLVIGMFMGVVLAWFSNKDLLHSILRFFRMTQQTSFESEWFGAFSSNRGQYIILNMKGGRRLFGWPEEWPNQHDNGHFVIAEPEWLVENDGVPERVPLDMVCNMLIPAEDVELVEFLNPP